MAEVRRVIDRRVNAIGVAEPIVQTAGSNRIIVELPGIQNPDAAIDLIRQTALLEFVDFSAIGGCTAPMPPAGSYILTNRQLALRQAAPESAPTPEATAEATAEAAPTAEPTAEATAEATPAAEPTPAPPEPTPEASPLGSKANPFLNPCTNLPFNTVMTGAGLRDAQARLGGQGGTQYVVGFELNTGSPEAQAFAAHTGATSGNRWQSSWMAKC